MTDAHPISRFPVPDPASLPDDIRLAIAKVAEKSGFVPNVFLALAHRPAEFRAFFAYHDALMDKDEGLTRAERELIVVATSGLNQCQYCVVAHGAILRIRAKNPLIADQVAVNWRKADLEPRERAMLAYAEKVALNAQQIGEADHATLREAGFSPDEIWDIGAIAAFFGMSNRLVNAGDIRPNDEFYLLGRM
ncbi:MAG: peroxidase-related enzyme [Paracoccus sp. (in: a-proteobacteria)]|uniref:peroxidase-related enzyme n=1 Tax=unclassified Paracoccus (in: a-proteobacteria) TaxID=2688777 RepID=UPI000C5C6633|nr:MULTISPECIES: peroxidase-related enzyme [unclassified Paracoccus (in: a-proteobacteria)]MAL27014.1 alkylhydroperoxidase [Croceicoccus sp.]MCS5601049.1 peroxidase-related enzyme [Paracoccus sp. (in: a-proteobacteria)]HIC66571.1 alkylhydroperoxidase [Paracoccus sp. (in: a-proteobacteria)]|tara:strand:+ start:345 stop:920 length:576 start_codon:yes stop_codon:yes gene_type:complete